jgi:hypothetical protein
MGSRAALLVGVMVVAVGCGRTRAPARPPADSAAAAALGDSALDTTRPSHPEEPRVPFGDDPCQSLSSAEEARLGMSGPVEGTRGRAPDMLAIDNTCTYTRGSRRYVRVGYQSMVDYGLASSTRSTTHRAPGDLPGAFYDRRDGLWFTRNGYYVVVIGESRFREPVARIVDAKLSGSPGQGTSP